MQHQQTCPGASRWTYSHPLCLEHPLLHWTQKRKEASEKAPLGGKRSVWGRTSAYKQNSIHKEQLNFFTEATITAWLGRRWTSHCGPGHGRVCVFESAKSRLSADTKPLFAAACSSSIGICLTYFFWGKLISYVFSCSKLCSSRTWFARVQVQSLVNAANQ